MNSKHWDAVIIGTGFGGSTAARQLAKAGMRVLLLDQGDWVKRDDSAWDAGSILIDRRYKAASPYEADGMVRRSLVYPDTAVGGNSVFYGAASLRLREDDFRAVDSRPAPERPLGWVDWPLRYRDLEPWYQEAEELLNVAGSAGTDPVEPRRSKPYPQSPQPYSRPARHIAEAGERLGLQPFPLPLAINYNGSNGRTACIQCMTCDLFPCKIEAKNDLTVTALPECTGAGAVIRPNTIASHLLQKGGRITGVACVDARTGARFTVSCGVCIVSCGAIGSARLLLASGLDRIKPNGALIGRYLMRHCNGIVIGMFPFETNPEGRFNKQVAFTDYYFGDKTGREPEGPWGMLQALQVPPPEYMRSQAPFPVGAAGAATSKFHMYLLCIAEDLPNPENRVMLHATRRDGFGMPIADVYARYARRDRLARRGLYRAGARLLREAGAVVRLRKPINTYSHAIGSCRFGESPESAVLDPNCNFFGVQNLFVVDGSFMPTSGGVNPSLTIAANGLRVGRYLVREFDRIATRSAGTKGAMAANGRS